MNSAAQTLVDARGLLCPWPVLRLCRAARELPGNKGEIRILADDPSAATEIDQLCRERGWGFAPDQRESGAFNVVIG